MICGTSPQDKTGAQSGMAIDNSQGSFLTAWDRHWRAFFFRFSLGGHVGDGGFLFKKLFVEGGCTWVGPWDVGMAWQQRLADGIPFHEAG